MCRCANIANAVTLLFVTLRRQPISILAYYHINKPCSKHLWHKYLQPSLILPNFAVKLTL